MKSLARRELAAMMCVERAVLTKTRHEHTMFYVYELPRERTDQAITFGTDAAGPFDYSGYDLQKDEQNDVDIDFVDDALLNTAPHNVIEKQLLRGDVIGLALMSGAIIWSAMGAFG